MPNLNKVMLIGNLTRDPEVKFTPKGTAIAEIGLAINRAWKNEAGEKQEETTFVDVTLWGRQAEIARDFLAKGKPVYIEGRLQLDSWDDKQTGQKRNKLKVTGEQMQLLGARDGSGGGNYDRGASASAPDEYDQRPARPAPQPRSGGFSQGSSGGGGGKPRPAPQPVQDEDDDIPF